MAALQLFVSALLFLFPVEQRTDFSGTWESQELVFNNEGVVGGSVIKIEQTADVIRIRRTYGRESIKNPPVILTIRLDGSQSENPYYAVHRPGLSGAITSRATWAGNRLVIVTTRTMTDSVKKTVTKTDTRETFSLDGRRLTVERVVTPNGGGKDVWLWHKR